MGKKKSREPKYTATPDQSIVEENKYLEIDKSHKDWFHPHTMGKQRGKPRYDMVGKNVRKIKNQKSKIKI